MFCVNMTISQASRAAMQPMLTLFRSWASVERKWTLAGLVAHRVARVPRTTAQLQPEPGGGISILHADHSPRLGRQNAGTKSPFLDRRGLPDGTEKDNGPHGEKAPAASVPGDAQRLRVEELFGHGARGGREGRSGGFTRLSCGAVIRPTIGGNLRSSSSPR